MKWQRLSRLWILAEFPWNPPRDGVPQTYRSSVSQAKTLFNSNKLEVVALNQRRDDLCSTTFSVRRPASLVNIIQASTPANHEQQKIFQSTGRWRATIRFVKKPSRLYPQSDPCLPCYGRLHGLAFDSVIPRATTCFGEKSYLPSRD